jgi:hypothetical protein
LNAVCENKSVVDDDDSTAAVAAAGVSVFFSDSFSSAAEVWNKYLV